MPICNRLNKKPLAPTPLLWYKQGMSRTVFCKKYQQELPALEKPPFPGPKGQDLYDNYSAKAWDEWQAHQTMLINERHLNMMEPGSRAFLAEERDKFMANEEVAQAEGYVPPDK